MGGIGKPVCGDGPSRVRLDQRAMGPVAVLRTQKRADRRTGAQGPEAGRVVRQTRILGYCGSPSPPVPCASTKLVIHRFALAGGSRGRSNKVEYALRRDS